MKERLVKSTSRSKSSNKRELLLRAAITEFARNGYANTEVQAITDRCSLAKGTLYLYFKSKENLFWEAFLAIFREIERCIQKIHLSDLETIEKIRTSMISAAELFVKNPEYIPIIAQMRSIPPDQVPQEVTRLTENTIYAPLYNDIRDLMVSGLVPRKNNVQDYTNSLLNAIWGVFMFYRAKEDTMTLPERVLCTVDLFLYGMIKR